MKVNSTEFRKNMKVFLDGIPASGPLFIGNSLVILEADKYNNLERLISSLKETLEIVSNKKLLNQILKVADTLEEETRLGHLHSFEEAFGDEHAG